MITKRLISVKSIVADLVDITDPEVLQQLPTLIKWGIVADKRIKTYYPYKRQKFVGTVSNCCMEIPCDAVYLMYIGLGDPGCDCSTLWGAFKNSNMADEQAIIDLVLANRDVSRTFMWFSGPEPNMYHFDWTIQGNKIVFENMNLDGQTVTLLYYGMQTDGEGNYMVWDSHRDAISLFLKRFIAKNMQWKNFKKMRLSNMELAFVDQLDTEYHRAVREARAIDAETNHTDEDHIYSFINNPSSGKGNLYL